MRDRRIKYCAFVLAAIEGGLIGWFTIPMIIAMIICILGVVVATLLAIYEYGSIFKPSEVSND